jgi:flagellin-like protein
MKEESTGVSPVIATILLIAITVVAVGIVMAFVAGLGTPATAPVATLKVVDESGNTGKLLLKHEGGSKVLWKDVKIAVVENEDAAVASGDYVDPDDVITATEIEADPDLSVGESVHIENSSKPGGSLVVGHIYHIMIKHIPSNTIILDTNAEVKTS